MAFMYDSKFVKHPGKLQMHWLAPYVIKFIIDGGSVQLQQLNSVMFPNLVNGIRINPYQEGPMRCDS